MAAVSTSEATFFDLQQSRSDWILEASHKPRFTVDNSMVQPASAP